jgi:hypothetical protein
MVAFPRVAHPYRARTSWVAFPLGFLEGWATLRLGSLALPLLKTDY